MTLDANFLCGILIIVYSNNLISNLSQKSKRLDDMILIKKRVIYNLKCITGPFNAKVSASALRCILQIDTNISRIRYLDTLYQQY